MGGLMPERLLLGWLFAGLFAFGATSDNIYFIQVLSLAGIFTLAGVGLNLLLGGTGQFSLGQAGFFGIGAYTSAWVLKTLHVPWLAGALVGTLAAGVSGIAVGYSALRLRDKYLAMATLGFSGIVYGLLMQFGWTGGPLGYLDIPGIDLFGWQITKPTAKYFVIWAACALAVLLAVMLQQSRVGRALAGIREDELAARTCGVDVATYKVKVFAIAAAMAGVAGALYASYLGSLHPARFHISESINLVVAVVLGGRDSIGGTILGVAALTVLPEFLRQWDDYRPLTYGILLVLLILFIPDGMGGLWRKAVSGIASLRGSAQVSGVQRR